MNDDKLLRMSAWLLVFSGFLIVLGQLLAHTAIGQVTPFENPGTWVAVVGGGFAVAIALTVIVASISKAAHRSQRASTMNATAPAAQPQPARQKTRRTYNYEELQW